MAQALARGFISKGVRAAQMVATDPLASRWKAFESFGVAPARNEIEVGPSFYENHRLVIALL
jgi:hypothetical protein